MFTGKKRKHKTYNTNLHPLCYCCLSEWKESGHTEEERGRETREREIRELQRTEEVERNEEGETKDGRQNAAGPVGGERHKARMK